MVPLGHTRPYWPSFFAMTWLGPAAGGTCCAKRALQSSEFDERPRELGHIHTSNLVHDGSECPRSVVRAPAPTQSGGTSRLENIKARQLPLAGFVRSVQVSRHLGLQFAYRVGQASGLPQPSFRPGGSWEKMTPASFLVIELNGEACVAHAFAWLSKKEAGVFSQACFPGPRRHLTERHMGDRV